MKLTLKTKIWLGLVTGVLLIGLIFWLGYRHVQNSTPAIITLTPNNGQTNVLLDSPLSLHFSTQVTTNDFHFSLSSRLSLDPISNSSDSKTLTSKPAALLQPKTMYTVTVTSTRPFLSLDKKPVTALSWQFTTADENPTDAAGREQVGDDEQAAGDEAAFYAAHPLLKAVDLDNNPPPDAVVDYDKATDRYTITLDPPINKPFPDDASYNQLLTDTKDGVITWMKSLGVDPSGLQIDWQNP